jgi:hypothetical protein
MSVYQKDIHNKITCANCTSVLKEEVFWFWDGTPFCNSNCYNEYKLNYDPSSRIIQKKYMINAPRSRGDNEKYFNLRYRIHKAGGIHV